MFYLALNGEVETTDMINKARQIGKEICVPLCDNQEKRLRPALLQENSILEKGPYNTWQPQIKIDLPIEKLDLVIVPGLAFDKDGNRLGRGRGYYDRLLKIVPHNTHSIGLAFDFQILTNLPFNQEDTPVEKVLFA